MIFFFDELKSIFFDNSFIVNSKFIIFQRISLIIHEKRINNQFKKNLEKIIIKFQIAIYLFANMNENEF